jgi:uncharacterized protein (DUF885 family)
LLLALVLACVPRTEPPPAAPDEGPPSTSTAANEHLLAAALDDAEVGVDDPALRALLRRHWADRLERAPLEATRLGVHAYDDRLGDFTRAGLDREAAARRAFLRDARALDPAALTARDRTTLAILRAELEIAIESEVCRFHEWLLSPARNPVSQWNYLPEVHPVERLADARAYLARVRQIPAAIAAEREHLARGLAGGRVTTAESARRVLRMLDAQLAQPLDAWPLLAPLAPREALRSWPAEPLAGLRAELRAAVELELRPALVDFAEFVRTELLPRARPPERSGVMHLPDGLACYRAQIRQYTSLDLDPAEIHAIGLREIDRLDREIAALGERLFAARDLSTTLQRLRSDPALFFASADEVEAAARAGLAAARARIPEFFGVLPRAGCVVRRIPDYEAPYTHIAYYRPPFPDGSKPGEFFINTSRPETRPRYEARVLAIHESIPGHHLQIAVAQELAAVPALRKHAEQNVFAEGWALYTEHLAEAMGLYETDLDRMGKLSFAAWRAARLVVDTGIHALGWSRDEGERFILQHSALAPGNVTNEVDRYINWPAQALGYKLGELEIRRLRADAERELGPRFDLKAFHDAVLGGGAVPLPVLRDQVAAHVAARRG